jgi:transketolase
MHNLFGFRILVPADPNQTDRMVRFMTREAGNFLLALGRSHAPVILDEHGVPLFGEGYEFVYGKADVIRRGKRAAIITCGALVPRALRAWEMLKERGLEVLLLNFSCPTDIDLETLRTAAGTGVIITYEDHNVRTGLGSIIANALAEERITCKFRKMGIREYGSSGSPDALYRMQGLDEESLVAAVLDEMKIAEGNTMVTTKVESG